MAVDLMSVYEVLGSGSCRIRVTPEKTERIRQIISELESLEQVSSCITIFLSYYPDESLLEFCFQRFFEIQPDSVDSPRYVAWKRQLSILSQLLQQHHIHNWRKILCQKAMTYCPHLAREMKLDQDLTA